MNEQTRPLEIAFMGRNLGLSTYLLEQFADDNAEQIAQRRRERLTLIDGTTITLLSPGRVRSGIDGRRFDQLILADDRRELIRAEAAHEIEVVRYGAMCLSCVPEEYKVLYYDIDAPAPCLESAVTMCHTCHEREHSAGRKTALTVKISVEGLDEVTKKFAALGTTIAEASEAFRKMAEAAKEAIPLEEEIALIRANPNLSRFQKWRLIRKIRKGRRA